MTFVESSTTTKAFQKAVKSLQYKVLRQNVGGLPFPFQQRRSPNSCHPAYCLIYFSAHKRHITVAPLTPIEVMEVKFNLQ